MKDAKDSVLENHNWLFLKISKSQEKYGFLASAFIMSEKWGITCGLTQENCLGQVDSG